MSELSINVRTDPSYQRFVAVRPSVSPLPGVKVAMAADGRGTVRRLPRRQADTVALASSADRRQLPAGDRAALLVGTAGYDHDGYPELPTAAAGLRQLKQVLERPDVGMMDTCVLVENATRAEMMRGIEAFLEGREYNDTVLMYLTGYAGVSPRDGRLFFVASDTDPDDLDGTGVSADFLRRLLQECRAASKVVLLDYCAAPGEPEATVRHREVMPEPAGVYVITAAETLRPAETMAEPETAAGTTRFTGEIVEGLRTGRVKTGLGPWVTADDLSSYVAERLGRPDVPAGRRPATSTLAVTGNHVIARSAVRALSLLEGSGGSEKNGDSQNGDGDGADEATERPATAAGRADAEPAEAVRPELPADPGWRELIAYYRACTTEATAPDALPSRAGEGVDYFPIGSGAELLLSEKAAIAPAPAGVDTFDWKERDVWYGYPMVTLASGGRRHSASALAQARVAPLLVRRAEVTVDARGAAALRPVGPVMPHAGVLQACLDDQEAASVLASWQQSWRSGDDEQLLAAVRQLMKRLGLAELEPLDPAELTAGDLRTATRTGAQNAACVLYVQSTRAASLAVSAELGAVSERVDEIPGTALEYLGKPVGLRASQAAQVPPVTPDPLNESHEAALASAMTRPLTVAAAPPGTGNAQLIADVVATAVAAGQKVLVASPDDAALQRLADRCAEIAPGLLIKTGDAQARAEEKQLLRQLLRQANDETGRRPRQVVAAELAAARARVADWRGQLADREALEARLRKTCAARAAAAERLGLATDVLDSAWRDDAEAMTQWIERARAATAVRFLGGWRRRRTASAYLRALDAGGPDTGQLRRGVAEPDAFDALLLFSRAEQRLRADRSEVEKVSDDLLDAQGEALADIVRKLSAELLRSVLAEQAVKARQALDARRMALEPGGKDRQASQRDLMNHLGGWAVTVEAAQQLALEPGLFDLVVIDEAHRCSVAAVLPLLFRARRALVVGDPRLRRQGATLSDHRVRRAREQAGLRASWLEERGLEYRTHSAYDAAVNNVDEPVLLDEHVGCHPGIARIVDDHLYGGRLTVLTDVTALRRARDPETGESTLLLWEDVRGTPEEGANGGSWRNQAEIDRVVWAVNELRDQLPKDATIAVVTPFRAQVEELRSLFRFESVRVAAVQDGIEPSDAVVLSLVAGEDTPAQTARWVETRTDLWNAAITRARSHVVTVGQHAFWSRQSGLPALLARLSSVRSFHVRPIPPSPPQVEEPADGLADLLHERLLAAGYPAVERNALVDGYRCDLLVGTPDGEGVAVLLDRGVPTDGDAARHLRLLLRRRGLLAGLTPESGSAVSRVSRVVRVPTWQVRSGQALAGLFD